MTRTGWTPEAPAAAAMPVTEHLLRNRERAPGDALAMAEARSRAADARQAREDAEAIRDPDEAGAAMVNRGYSPGMLSSLMAKRADKTAELETEQAKIEKGERVTARVRGMLERGQIGAMEAHQAMSGDFGDASRAEKLEEQIARLDQRIAEAGAMIAPPHEQRQPDAVESATRAAHDEFRRVTAEMMAGKRPVPARGRRPFAGRGSVAVRSEVVTCQDCITVGASPDESFLLHSDPWKPDPDPPPPAEDNAVYRQKPYCRGCGSLEDWCTCPR